MSQNEKCATEILIKTNQSMIFLLRSGQYLKGADS